MRAIETTASFDEKGELRIENLPPFKNRQVKVLFLFDEEDDDIYMMAAQGLANAYSDDEPEYDESMLKERNPLYRDDRR